MMMQSMKLSSSSQKFKDSPIGTPSHSAAATMKSSMNMKASQLPKKSMLASSASNFANKLNFNNINNPSDQLQNANNTSNNQLQIRDAAPAAQSSNHWQAMLPPAHKTQYTGGTDCPRVIAKVKQLTFEEKLVNYSDKQVQTLPPALQVIDKNTLILSNLNEDPKKKVVQKEKSYEFDYVQGEQEDNQILFKREFSTVVTNFIGGINQSIIVFGTDNSGKTQTMVGNMRDPGMFVMILKEIFEILYESSERENTSLKMSMFYNRGMQFHDLLISHEFPLRLVEKENGEIFPLGTSEVILTNLRTGLKILKIGLDKLESDPVIKVEGNIVLHFKCERAESHSNKQAVVSVLKVIKTSDAAYQEMITDGKDDCMMLNLMTCLRLLSNVSNKKKLGTVPFRKDAFTEYMRESFIGNSQTMIMCCLNNTMKKSNDTANILRLGNICKKVSSNSFPITFSTTLFQSTYSDLLENMANTVSMWVKEFYGELDKTKIKRVRIVIRLLHIFEKYLFSLLDSLEQQIQIDLIKNALFGKILDLHCKEYSGSITSEDIKEFYIAKIQRYALKSLHDQFITLYPSIHFVLQQLEITKETLFRNKSKITNTFRLYIDAKRLGTTTGESRFPQSIMNDVASLTNSDIEKLAFLLKLLVKFQDSADHLICHNMYIPQNVRAEITNSLKDFKFLQQLLIDDGVHLTEETTTNQMNASQISLRFQTPSGKPMPQNRNSSFKTTQYMLQKSRSRVNSRDNSMSRIYTESANNHNRSNMSLNKSQLENNNNNNENENSDRSSSIDSPLQTRQGTKTRGSPAPIKRASSSVSNDEIESNQIDAARIRQLQIQLGIIPRPKDIFVNNTKLSIKTATSTPTFVFTPPPPFQPQPPQTPPNSQKAIQLLAQKNAFNQQNLLLLQQKNRKPTTRSTAPSGAKRTILHEEDELVTKIFTNNTRYTTTNWMSGPQKTRQIFITQNPSSTRNQHPSSPSEVYPTHYYSGNSNIHHKTSLTGLNFFQSSGGGGGGGGSSSSNNTNGYSIRFPEMITTLYSFKLPSLSQTLSKDNFKKFMKQ